VFTAHVGSHTKERVFFSSRLCRAQRRNTRTIERYGQALGDGGVVQEGVNALEAREHTTKRVCSRWWGWCFGRGHSRAVSVLRRAPSSSTNTPRLLKKPRPHSSFRSNSRWPHRRCRQHTHFPPAATHTHCSLTHAPSTDQAIGCDSFPPQQRWGCHATQPKMEASLLCARELCTTNQAMQLPLTRY